MTEHNRTIDPPAIIWPDSALAPELRQTADSVAMWDLDGTLTRWDTLIPFLSRLLGPAQLAEALIDAAGRVPPGRGWRAAGKAHLLQATLAGRDVASVNRIARAYAARLVVDRLRPDSVRRWRWHQDQGHRLVLASASPDLYVRHVGAILGADEVISTEMEVVNGWLTGRMATSNCRGEEKARRLRAYLMPYRGRRLWVYTDSTSDRPALALADVPVRVSRFWPLRTPPAELGRKAPQRTGISLAELSDLFERKD